MAQDSSTICLFDVDGTLTAPRNRVRPEMEECLQELKKKVIVGLVSGSDISKLSEQMSGDTDVTQRFDYVFSENGLVVHKNGELTSRQSILKFMGEEKCQQLINYALKLMSDLTLPCKRGTFVEFRSGLINFCPVGRSCSQAERDEFSAYDKKHGVREEFVLKLKAQFPDAGFKFAIGGQISVDVYPVGWDKTYCLGHLEKEGFKKIHFFGDKTAPGGNDHEIFADERVIGNTVLNPENTIQLIQEQFLSS